MHEKYLIGHVAHILNISKDTLRYYDKLGIVSPKKESSNNYRYYTLEDLLSLSYVLVFKDLGIPLEEIKQLITNNSLSDFSELLNKQETIIESKIKDLLNLKKKVLSFQTHIQTVQTYKGHVHTTMSPGFVYQGTRKEWDSQYTGYLIEMKNHDNIDAPTYSILISKNIFEASEEKITFRHGVSGIIHDLTLTDDLLQYTYIPPRMCVHTVISAAESFDEKALINLQSYLTSNHLTITDDILARNIAFEHRNESPLDYYEIWIPIKPNP